MRALTDPPGGPVTLLVDLTHGVGYTVAATLEAARLAALAASAAHRVEVRLEVFNFDPYPAAPHYTPTLRLWRVAVDSVKPPGSAHELARLTAKLAGAPFSPVEAEGGGGEGAARRAREALERRIPGGSLPYLEALAAAVAYNAPLAVATLPGLAAAPLPAAVEGLAEAYWEALRSASLERRGTEVVVEWLARPVLGAFKYYTALAALWEYARGTVVGEGLDPEVVAVEGAQLGVLERVARNVGGPLVHARLRELGEIKVKLAARECGHPLAGRLIRGGAGAWLGPKGEPCRGDVRDFAAHAGLEKSLADAYMPESWDPAGARFRYRRDCLPALASTLRSLLPLLA